MGAPQKTSIGPGAENPQSLVRWGASRGLWPARLRRPSALEQRGALLGLSPFLTS